MSEKKVINIENNFYFTARQENGAAVKAANNFYFYTGTTAGQGQADRMTKDTSITKPVKMTKDTSITDRVPQKLDKSGESSVEIVNNFIWNGGSTGSNSVSVSNNFNFGGEDDRPAGMTQGTGITNRAMNRDQGSNDPAELPNVPNVGHQHIK